MKRIFLIVACLALFVTVKAQPYLRGIMEDTQNSIFVFVSVNVATGDITTLAPLLDSLSPLGNGAQAAFNSNTQTFYYLALGSGGGADRYIVSLNAFNGQVNDVIPATAVSDIEVNQDNGLIYGIRYQPVLQFVQINPSTGNIVSYLNFSGANPSINSYTPASYGILSSANYAFLAGSFGTPKLMWVINNATGATIASPTLDVVLTEENTSQDSMYIVTRQFSPTKYTLAIFKEGQSPPYRVVIDSLPLRSIDANVTTFNPGTNQLFVRGTLLQGQANQVLAINVNTGAVQSVVAQGELADLASTTQPPNAVTSSICGTVYLDKNNNGQQDTGENGMGGQNITINPGGFQVITNTTGQFSVNLTPGTYTVTMFPGSNYFVSSLPLNYTINLTGGQQTCADFGLAISPGATQDSVQVSVSGGRAVVGRKTSQTITVTNKGTTTATGTATYTEGEHIKITGTSQAPVSVNNGVYTFEVEDLQPGETRQIQLELQVPPDPDLRDETNYANVDINMTTDGGGTIQESDQICNRIYGSYDPNDKTLNPSDMDTTLIPGDVARYRIRFQNVGNDTAYDISIRDTLDAGFDISTFSLLSASPGHNYNFTLEGGNIAIWDFPNILLPDSGANQLGSNGFVEYTIQTKADNALGTHIDNRAGIFFDFNPPVITNTSRLYFELPSGIPELDKPRLQVYPNPSSGLFSLEVLEPTAIATVSHVWGKTVYEATLQQGQQQLDLQHLPSGIYLLQVGDRTARVVVW